MALVLLVLVVALGLRIGVIAHDHKRYVPQTDAAQFDQMAVNLKNGLGFGYAELPPFKPADKQPTAIRAPLYPLSLAVVYDFAGRSWTAGRIFNALLGTLIVALVGILGSQIWNRRLGWVAMAIAAVWPTMILTGSSLLVEPLLVSLSLASVAAALQHRRKPKGLWWPAVSGITLGLAVLTREIAFALVVPNALLLWTARKDRPARFSRRALAAPILALFVSFVVVIPWTIRNAMVMHAFIPVSDSSGVGLAGTYNETVVADRVNQAQWIEPWRDPKMWDLMRTMKHPTEVKIDRKLRKASLDIEKKHPGYIFRVAYWNTERLFDLDGGHYTTRIIAPYVSYDHKLAKLSVYASYLLFLLAILGLALFFKRVKQAPWEFWAIPVIVYVGLVVFLPASIRYRASMEPYFVLLAALPVCWALERLLGWWNGRRSAPAAA